MNDRIFSGWWRLALALLSGCAPAASNRPDAGPPSDITAPWVVATFPNDGVVGAPVEGPISIEFSETMNTDLMRLATDPQVDLGTPTWSFDDSLVTFQLRRPLQPNTTYSLRVSGKDLAGQSLSGETHFSFTTGGP